MSGHQRDANATRSRSAPMDALTLPPGATAEARKEAICEVIRRTGLHPLHAARSVGVSSSAYYRLVEGDPDFRDDIDAATSTFARKMAAVIARAAVANGSTDFASTFRSSRAPYKSLRRRSNQKAAAPRVMSTSS